jgi:hypothetical protein
MILNVPPTATNLAEWVRKAAFAINALIKSLGAFGTSVAVDGDYTAGEGDYLILVDATAGDVVIDLPAGRLGKQLVIKRQDASGNDVNIVPSGTETIDGDTALPIPAQYMTFTVMGIPGGWAVL